MDWRATALVPEGAAPHAAAMDCIVPTIPRDQQVVLAFLTSRFEMSGWVGRMATVVLTDRALFVSKDRLFGSPRVDRVVRLEEISGSGFGPLLGVGPTWEVVFRAEHGAVATMYFDGPADAEQVAQEIRAAVSLVKAEGSDPDLALLHRRLRAGRAHPPGELGKTLSPEQLVQESRRLRQQLASGDLRAAWDRRVELGYGIPSDGMPQPDRFWLNAAPALAALRLGLKDHPMVPMCCGVAEQEHEHADPEQRAAVEEFNALFFG